MKQIQSPFKRGFTKTHLINSVVINDAFCEQ